MAILFKEVFHLPISEGTIDNMLTRFASKITPIYEQIRHRVSQSKVVGSDETGSKVANKKGWFHTWQTTHLTFIAASMNRGYETVKEYFSQGFQQATLVSDCWAAQLKTKAHRHQLCIVHLQRELLSFIDAFKEDKWSLELKVLFDQSIAVKRLSGSNGLSDDAEIQAIKDRFQLLLDVDETGKHRKLVAFIKRLRKHRDSVFVFLDNPQVPYQNNASERALRMVKVKTKVSGCFRTFEGAVRFAKIRSVIDTTIKNQQSTFDALNLLAKLRASSYKLIYNALKRKNNTILYMKYAFVFRYSI
jgi:transposase